MPLGDAVLHRGAPVPDLLELFAELGDADFRSCWVEADRQILQTLKQRVVGRRLPLHFLRRWAAI